MPQKVCFDSCALQRVFDVLSTADLQREARATEHIIHAATLAKVDLVWSAYLTLECIALMPLEKGERRIWAEYVRDLCTHHVDRSAAISERASDLVRLAAIKQLDALHLASAESAGAILVTVDRKGFLERVRRAGVSTTLIMTPPELVAHLGPL